MEFPTEECGVTEDTQNERETASDDAKEDLELTAEDADQVRGGLISKDPKVASTDLGKEKW
ncbi:MAG TPA: hypothetical protein VFV62_05030 [Gaiellaceae bacterium]|nr:hypothetical protein [Gaiellaceae bacterium]